MMVSVDLAGRRRQIYQHYAATDSPPALTASEGAALESSHVVVVERAGGAAFANPFATGRAPFRIKTEPASITRSARRTRTGLLAARHADGTVESACPDCDQPISVSVLNVALAGAEAVVQFLVPADGWYEDFAFT
jgi:hypothetical protein